MEKRDFSCGAFAVLPWGYCTDATTGCAMPGAFGSKNGDIQPPTYLMIPLIEGLQWRCRLPGPLHYRAGFYRFRACLAVSAFNGGNYATTPQTRFQGPVGHPETSGPVGPLRPTRRTRNRVCKHNRQVSQNLIVFRCSKIVAYTTNGGSGTVSFAQRYGRGPVKDPIERR